MAVGFDVELPHTLTPDRSDEEVEALIGRCGGYNRHGSVAVDYHQDGLVLFNYDTGTSIIFTFEQLKQVIRFAKLPMRWYEEYLERQRNSPSST